MILGWPFSETLSTQFGAIWESSQRASAARMGKSKALMYIKQKPKRYTMKKYISQSHGRFYTICREVHKEGREERGTWRCCAPTEMLERCMLFTFAFSHSRLPDYFHLCLLCSSMSAPPLIGRTCV